MLLIINLKNSCNSYFHFSSRFQKFKILKSESSLLFTFSIPHNENLTKKIMNQIGS